MPRPLKTGRITARTAPAVANTLASAHRAVATARVLQHRLGETEAIPALAGLHSAPALGLEGLVDDRFDLGPIVARAQACAAQADGDRDRGRAALAAGSLTRAEARWAHATDPVEHGGRTELWHTRLARQVGDDAVESGQWVRAIWARDFEQYPAALDHPEERRSSHRTEGGEDSPNVRQRADLARADAALPRDGQLPAAALGKPWDPPVIDVEHLMLTSQGGWLDSASPPPRSPTRTSRSWSGATSPPRGATTSSRWSSSGSLLPFGHRSAIDQDRGAKVHLRRPERARPAGQPGIRGPPSVHHRRGAHPLLPQHARLPGRPALCRAGAEPPTEAPRPGHAVLERLDPHHHHRADRPPRRPGQPRRVEDAFFPMVGGNAFPFKVLATDREGNVVEYAGPMMFVATRSTPRRSSTPSSRSTGTAPTPCDGTTSVGRRSPSPVDLGRHRAGHHQVDQGALLGRRPRRHLRRPASRGRQVRAHAPAGRRSSTPQ